MGEPLDICLVADNPETPTHPVIGTVLRRLRATHTVRLLDVRGLTGEEAIAQEAAFPLAEVYLLKSHTHQALTLARHLEQRGALVINSWAAASACQDRELMVRRLYGAHLPCPRTWPLRSWASLQEPSCPTLRFPLIIKSRYSHRGDLVAKVHDVDQLRALAPQWREEPVILQEFVQGDGWDIKIWVIDRQLFAARRRTPLEGDTSEADVRMCPEELPREWRSLALEVGREFDLRVYGVDLMMTETGPRIVDVNSFPGFRSVAGADSALISLIERVGAERRVAA